MCPRCSRTIAVSRCWVMERIYGIPVSDIAALKPTAPT